VGPLNVGSKLRPKVVKNPRKFGLFAFHNGFDSLSNLAYFEIEVISTPNNIGVVITKLPSVQEVY
jgi:hypothetical protein